MVFEVFIPYFQGASVDMKDNMNGYYANERDYANALITEDAANVFISSSIADTTSRKPGTYYGGFGRKAWNVDEKVVFAKAECNLHSPNGFMPETVDSMIDKFASQCEFLVTLSFDFNNTDEVFIEEVRQWIKETQNIYIASREIKKKGGSSNDVDMFIETNLPRRDLRLSFLNKSNQRVNFILRACEIEEPIAKNRFILYVKNMEILKT